MAANDNKAMREAKKATKHMSESELLYVCIEQLCAIAHVAKLVAEIHSLPLTDASRETSTKALADLLEMTRGLDTLPVLSRLTVCIAAGNASKHCMGAQLQVLKAEKQVVMNMFYGPGPNDFTSLFLAEHVATQIKDGLAQALAMLGPKLIMPDNGLVKPH